jgi:hypothetical protein
MKVITTMATRRSMMSITRIGVDLAINSYSICSVDANDKVVLERDLKRKDLLEYFANTKSC